MNWCWAASVQDVLAQAGLHDRQEDIAARLDGWPVDRPATLDELVWLLRSYGFRAWQTRRPGSPRELSRTLSGGWKLIAFVRPSAGPVGHYIVLQGMVAQTGQVLVSDPWTGETRSNTLAQLYAGWRWSDAVVVGTPVP